MPVLDLLLLESLFFAGSYCGNIFTCVQYSCDISVGMQSVFAAYVFVFCSDGVDGGGIAAVLGEEVLGALA